MEIAPKEEPFLFLRSLLSYFIDFPMVLRAKGTAYKDRAFCTARDTTLKYNNWASKASGIIESISRIFHTA